MKHLLLILIFLSVSAAAKNVEPSPKILKSAGFIFDHPEIQDSCVKESICQKSASEYCASKKAKFLRCSEQYKESWIITCECL